MHQAPDKKTADAELVRAAQRGDKRAFVEIVARHQAMVCGVALAIVADFAASEDVGQEAFLTAWRKIHDVRDPNQLRSWLAQIARNAAFGYIRARRHHDPLEHAPAVADDSLGPDEAAAVEEEMSLMRESLAKLPEAYRVPLVLFYRENESTRAVAEALGISEDAVRQRLARGREMLRDQMSGVIESFLKSTRPKTVFTMTVAAAIGALAAPATVAAAVFSGASVPTAAGASSSSTTPFLTAMSTSKTVLITAAVAVAVCIPVGYKLGPARKQAAKSEVLARVQKPPPPAVRKPNFADSALFAEWRALHEKHGTNAQAMPALYKAIGDLKDAFRRRAFRAALIAEWVQVDPLGGLAFMAGKGKDPNQRKQFFEEWLAVDPNAAVQAVVSGKTGWETVAREALPEIGRRVRSGALAPSVLTDMVTRLPAAESYWDSNVRDAFATIAEGDLTAGRSAAENVTGPNRDQALAGIARVWAASDVDKAIAWARSLPDGTDRDEVVRAALVGKAALDPVAALDLVGTVPAGGRYAHANTTTGARVLTEAASADFDATVAWLKANPGRLAREDLLGLSKAVTEKLNANAAEFLSAHARDGSLSLLQPAIESALLNNATGQKDTVWEWLKQQPPGEDVQALRKFVLRSGAWQDPPVALAFASDLPADAAADLKDLATSLFNGGSSIHRFDQMLARAPANLRVPLVEAAFNGLRSDYFEQPQIWVDRLSLLPETSRSKGIESLSRTWAEKSPEEALGWASSLANGPAHDEAVAGVAKGWARRDPRGAAEWVGTLPPGSARDRSVSSLAQAVADQFPREAWGWALSIGDPAERDRAAAHVAKAMAAHDPATARQWIATGPFTAATRVDLQKTLERAARGVYR